MGIILSAIYLPYHSLKKSRDKRKAKKIRKEGGAEDRIPQPYAQQKDTEEGLRDEHLAPVPPPQDTHSAEEGADTTGIGTGAIGEAEREVQVGAPLPLSGGVAT